MKKLLTIMSVVAVALTGAARDFTYNNIAYTVTSEANKTCMTRSGYGLTTSTGNFASGKLQLPEVVYDGETPYTLTAIGQLGFYKQSITELVLPSTIVEIQASAFENCSSLKEVTIPPSLQTVAMGAFIFTSNLQKINIADLSSWSEINFANRYANPL